MAEERNVYILCMRQGDLSPEKAIEYSAGDKHCSYCNEAVWFAPTSEKTLRRYPQARIICNECYSQKGPQEFELQAASPEQMKELRNRLKKYLH